MSESSSTTGGIGFSGVLFVVFLVLKLIGVIDWSWWWVTAPLWISIILSVAYAIVLWVIYKKRYGDE